MTPEAVEQAMKVLEIHERLENPGHTSNPDEDESARRLGDHEVEVLKEMCNVSIGPGSLSSNQVKCISRILICIRLLKIESVNYSLFFK